MSIIDRIRNLLCFSSSRDEEVSTQSLLEQRIAFAEGMISNHFQDDYITRNIAPDSTIVVVMKYNDRCEVSYGIAPEQAGNLSLINRPLRQLLSSATHSENDNAALRINTILVTRSQILCIQGGNLENLLRTEQTVAAVISMIAKMR